MLFKNIVAFLVELFPFHVRSKGISVFQWFSRMAGFFNQFVNPIGIANIGERHLFFRYNEILKRDRAIRVEILHQVNEDAKRSHLRLVALNTLNLSYCAFLAFEVVFVYIFFPETSGRSLEELAFCEFSVYYFWSMGSFSNSVRRRRAHRTKKTRGEGNPTGHG